MSTSTRVASLARVSSRLSNSEARTFVPRADHTWPIRDEILTFHDIPIESGARIPQVRVHYRLEGTLNAARDNLVLVVHALTGTSRASEWWKGVIDVDGAIDPTRHAVLCANLLGGCEGSTGPTIAHPDALPPITTRDQAAILARLLDALGVQTPVLICGGSLGGMVALEFAASFPNRVRSAVVLAAPATQTAQGLAWNTIKRRAIHLGGARDGLALARMVGMLSYRTPEGLERRFGRARAKDGEFLVNEWLNTHGEKLVERFDAASYQALLGAMDTHDVGRGRGGVAAALASLGDRLTGVGIPGDLLYPAECVREWTSAAGATYHDLASVHGHDGFLLETARVNAIVRDALARAAFSGTAATPRSPSIRGVDRQARSIRVALAGCGHVGGSLLDLLGENHGHDTSRVVVVRVLVRDSLRARPALAQAIARGCAPAAARITDATLLIDDDVDVLVEAIGGTTTAKTLVETALRRGVRVVTANKALLAEHGPALHALARANGTRLDFEGAVGGAIPVIRCLRSDAAGVGVTRVVGILNGTSNYVLERVADGTSLADAIRDAQRLGYAEADPRRDLSGEDAEDKLRVLAWLAFGVNPATLKVVRRGIDAETAAWSARVAAAGDRVKVIAVCGHEDNQLVARIVPTRVTLDDAWSAVSGAYNRIVIDSVSAGSLVFHGLGAGGRATAGAVLADVLTPLA